MKGGDRGCCWKSCDSLLIGDESARHVRCRPLVTYSPSRWSLHELLMMECDINEDSTRCR